MSKSFSCGELGVLCHNRMRGNTEDEVVQKAVEHARRSHGVDLAQSRSLMRLVRQSIRTEGQGREQR